MMYAGAFLCASLVVGGCLGYRKSVYSAFS